MQLSDLIAPAQRVAMVGLAKNTGKTVALGAILSELAVKGQRVGVTSVGRDGEERDVIDIRIQKPAIRLVAGSLVATTDSLLRASGVSHMVLEDTGVRTPLGRVLVSRLDRDGKIEVAGPSAAEDVRAVSDVMLGFGAEQVLIDGAIDRRAASSPAVADGLVISTGAALHEDIETVVEMTRDAVELACLPEVGDRHVRKLAAGHRESLLIDSDGGLVALPPGLLLTATASEIAQLLRAHPASRYLVVRGALCEPALEHLARAARGRELIAVVEDPPKVFLSGRSIQWLKGHGVVLQALRRVSLLGITVNPVAPGAHRFDSGRLRELLAEAVRGLPVLDVLEAGYVGRGSGTPGSSSHW